MHKSIAIRRRKTDCNACPDSSDPADATPGADPPPPFRQKNPRGVERGHHRVDLGLPPFPLAYSGDFVSWNFWVSRMPLGAVNAGILAALPKFALYIV